MPPHNRPHIWNRLGECIVCAMRSHWDGASDVCSGYYHPRAKARDKASAKEVTHTGKPGSHLVRKPVRTE